MADEQVVWTGIPRSGATSAGSLLPAADPDPVGAVEWLETRNTVYTLTDQRLKFTRGVLSKTTEDLELYRVRDTKFQQKLLGAHGRAGRDRAVHHRRDLRR
jgi:hypothetical protein